MRIALPLVALCLLSAGAYAQDSQSKLQPLYDGHHWFQLRDEVAQIDAPIFYKAAVAIAFNEPEADKYLRTAISSQPDAKTAYEARELLVGLYFRTGRYREASALAKDLLALKPDAADIRNLLPTLQALSAYPDQKTVSRKPCRVAMEVEDGNLALPVRVNGVASHYLFDNGFSLSGMSETEARRLKLTVRDVTTKLDTMGGQGVQIRVAVVSDLQFGGARLKHDAFYVVPDSQPPFNELPSGRQGILGLQVILALSRFQWNPKDSSFTILHIAKGTNRANSNLAFDGTSIFNRLGFERRPLDFSLDMGAQKTVLYRTFAQMFPAVKEGGSPEVHKLTGVGGSAEVESVLLPSLTFNVGGRDVLLKPAHILLKDNNSTSSWYVGNLGMDLLNQAGSVEIDFNSMTLMLRQ